MDRDEDRFPTGNPTWQYQNLKGYDKHREIDQVNDGTTYDLLLAVLTTGDCLFAELRLIREALERRVP